MTTDGVGNRDISQIRQDLDTSRIKDWRSIVTLIVFVLTNINVLFPFRVPIFVPRVLYNATFSSLAALRVIPKTRNTAINHGKLVRLWFPMNFITAPLIADLFLLAILAIGREEVKGGTLGANNISPLDIMLFFVSLAYIAISIDASGLIKYLAYRVLTWGGDAGHRLFFYLYSFFFALTAFIGNDPIILSGTPFLAYMTRVSSNIVHPRAWIYSQFAVANIASAILVSSNPTNLVVAGAFGIKFINYSANVIVPVIATGIVLFPCLLYIVFRNGSLIPRTIEMHQLPEDARGNLPRNPNIPKYRGNSDDSDDAIQEKSLPLEEIMNPYLDKTAAWFGSVIMAATLITVLSINAAASGKQHVFWVTLPAAVVMFLFDITWGWIHRHESRRVARQGVGDIQISSRGNLDHDTELQPTSPSTQPRDQHARNMGTPSEVHQSNAAVTILPPENLQSANNVSSESSQGTEFLSNKYPRTLQSIVLNSWRWSRETFPTATTVLTLLPLPLVPFAFCMFILVQALVTKGWIQVFAYGWDHWVNATGTIGAIGGMGFLSVILCNFAGTNIGTTILLSRVIQAWQDIHRVSGTPISNRTFWATVYSLAISVNYGAFSIAFSASLAGLLWRDILTRKHIRVRSLDFVKVNLPIIGITMVVGCVVLVGQVYVVRDDAAYDA